ncbi:MAG: hypothetical protein RLZZ283_770 [Candidatus Parcubacteria bacterium]|jgi:hypothetical protein
MTTFSIKEAFTFGWTTFKKNPWFFAGATFALMIASMVINGLTGGRYGVEGIVGSLISLAFGVLVSIAYSRLALISYTDPMKPKWQDLWAPEHILHMLGTTLLQGIIIGVGFVLLIIPGIIAALLLSFVQLLVVDKSMNPIEAIKKSYALAKGHMLQLFLFGLCAILLNAVGLIALVIGLVVTIPVTLLSFVYVYHKVSSLEGAELGAPVG